MLLMADGTNNTLIGFNVGGDCTNAARVYHRNRSDPLPRLQHTTLHLHSESTSDDDDVHEGLNLLDNRQVIQDIVSEQESILVTLLIHQI